MLFVKIAVELEYTPSDCTLKVPDIKFEPVISKEPLNTWVSSKLSPKILLPLAKLWVKYVTEELTMYCSAVKFPVTVRLPVTLVSPFKFTPAKVGRASVVKSWFTMEFDSMVIVFRPSERSVSYTHLRAHET